MEVVRLETNDPKEAAELVHPVLAHTKVVRIEPLWHITDLRSFYDELSAQLGHVLDIAEDFAQGGTQTGERWMEIRYDDDVPDMKAYRHSKNGQPLHTDESYVDDPADIMVFYCVNKATAGGETNYVDVFELIELLRSIDPALLEELTTVPLTYKKSELRRCRKIIDLEGKNGPSVNYNYYCIDPEASEKERQLNQRFFDFLELHVRGSYIEHPVALRPSEGVLWWDHFVLHGRRPFHARKTDDRLIWKTGLKWLA